MVKRNNKVLVKSKGANVYQEISRFTVDIVIPVFNRFDILDRCMKALPAAFKDDTGTTTFKVHLVDNGSTNPDEFYTNITRYGITTTITRYDKNKGFPYACNKGAARGTASYILFLNSDVILEPGAGRHLVKFLASNPKAGIAGMKLIFPDDVQAMGLNPHIRPAGKIQHVGLFANVRADFVHVFMGWSENHPKPNALKEVHAVTGAALLITRKVFNLADGFDEIYGQGCLTGDTLIYTENGIMPISELVGNQTHDIDILVGGQLTSSLSNLAYYNGVQDTMKVTLSKGYNVQGTLNHKVRVIDGDGLIGWKEIQELSVGDFVGIRGGANLFGTNHLSYNDAYLLGTYIANGNFEENINRMTITTADKEIHKFLIDNYGFHVSGVHCRKTNVKLFRELGKIVTWGWKALTKQIPSFILMADEETQVAFLRGLFDGDGTAIKDGRVAYSTSSKVMAQQLQVMLLNFGIFTSISPRIGDLSDNVNYILDLGRSRHQFYKRIGFGLSRKQAIEKEVAVGRGIPIPNQRHWYKRLYDSIPSNFNKYKLFAFHANNPSSAVTADTICKLLDFVANNCKSSDVDMEAFYLLSNVYEFDVAGVYWLSVKSVEDGGKQETYDLHVPDTNAYLANGMIVHNTYEDVDLCMTVQKMGYNIMVDTVACGTHYTGASAESARMGFPMNENRNIFLSRWGKFLVHSDWRVW